MKSFSRDTDVVDETVPPHTWLKVFTIKNMLLYIRPILLNDELQVGTWAEQWQLVLANSHISVQLEICTMLNKDPYVTGWEK